MGVTLSSTPAQSLVSESVIRAVWSNKRDVFEGVQATPLQDGHVQSACSGVATCLPKKVETSVTGNFYFQIVQS